MPPLQKKLAWASSILRIPNEFLPNNNSIWRVNYNAEYHSYIIYDNKIWEWDSFFSYIISDMDLDERFTYEWRDYLTMHPPNPYLIGFDCYIYLNWYWYFHVHGKSTPIYLWPWCQIYPPLSNLGPSLGSIPSYLRENTITTPTYYNLYRRSKNVK